MLTRLFTYRESIAIALIVLVSSVYACQLLCDFNIYNINAVGRTTTFSTPHHSQVDHKENHGFESHHHDFENDHQQHSDTNSDQGKKTNHHSGQDDNCCEEMTSSIFNSLIIQKIGIPSLEAKLFLVFEIEFPAFQESYNNLITENLKYYSGSSPPTLNGDIIVLVQSFLL